MLLAVDTSTTRAGIALYDGEVLAEYVWQAGRDHGRHLMPAIDETMRRLGKTPADLTAVAAGGRPGSLAGARVVVVHGAAGRAGGRARAGGGAERAGLRDRLA